MQHDLVIRGGTVVDGSGLGSYRGDVAVDDGVIVEVGRVTGRGTRELDATDAVVAPGFIDGHTHFDAQVFWDHLGTNSCWHGVTTVVMGNCGFTLAPTTPGLDGDLVLRNLEKAEDIPREVLRAGIPEWTWETYGEFRDALTRVPKAINYHGYVGHSAIRTWAMGERAFTEEASEADLEQMKNGLREALRSGALGFSTTRSPEHETADGDPVASRLATWDEVVELVHVLDEFPGSVFQFTQTGTTTLRRGAHSDELERQVHDLAASTSATIMFTVTGFQKDGKDIYEGLELVDSLNRVGRTVGHTPVRNLCTLASFEARMPFDSVPEWAEVRSLPLDEQRSILRDPDRRRSLVAAAYAGTYKQGLITETQRPDDYGELLVVRRADGPNLSVAELCGDSDPVDFIIQLALDSDFKQIFEQQISNRDFSQTYDALRHPATVIGASDAGAHVGQIASAELHTYLLAYWVRERGLFTLEQAVKMCTFDMAHAWGLEDRGLLVPGRAADLVIFDPDTVGPLPPEYVRDLPGGGRRLVQRATGIKNSIVNGVVAFSDGESTGEFAGRVLTR
jgi:N-acyl-D-aspartate/D-glutamate deacylase